MGAHFRFSRIDIALPIDDDIDMVALLGDGVNAPRECARGGMISYQAVDRPRRARSAVISGSCSAGCIGEH